MKKKILILGAGDDQVPLIKVAKEFNLFVICCDYTTTNPGLPFVDKHYQVDYTDREAVLNIAKEEQIDGVISNSEAAMMNVAYVVEQLGLVGNSTQSVRYLQNKSSFRHLQDQVGAYAPRHYCVQKADDIISFLEEMHFPIVIKPCVSSATRGVKVINTKNAQEIKDAFNDSLNYSWTNEVEIEEYVEMPSLSVIEGEIFVVGKDILLSGLYETKRTAWAPMIPAIHSCPLIVTQEQQEAIKNTITKIVDGAGLTFGGFNIEMYFTRSGELFVIELNPRQGGKRLPEFVKKHNGIDFYRLLVSLAVGNQSYYNEISSSEFVFKNNYVTKYMVFSPIDGVYSGLYISKDISSFITSVKELKSCGTIVRHAQNAYDAIAMIDLCFDDYHQQRFFVDNIERYVYPEVKS